MSAQGHWQAVARGSAYLRIGRPDRAFETVSGIHDEAPGAGEAMSIAGLALIRMGEYRAARLALDRAIQLQPKQFEALVALAELNFALGNGRRGIEVLEQALELRPREFRLWLTMGKVEHDLGDLPRAAVAYEHAVELKPSDRPALAGLIGALVLTYQSQRAEESCTKALEIYPDDPVILGFGARAAFDLNHQDAALALADRALRVDPHNVHALLARASVLVARSRWQEALPSAERAAASGVDRVALQILERIERKLGLDDRASNTRLLGDRAAERTRLMTELSKEVELRPEDPEIPWKLGKAAWELGSILLASRCFQAALALDPNFKPARESLEALSRSHPEVGREPGTPFAPATDLGKNTPGAR
jgi:tetratricopeptide (TPR) repeat protein